MSAISKVLGNPPTNFSTTLSAGISSSDLTIPLNSVSGLDTEGVGVIYEKDTDGNPVASSIEFIHWTGTSGNSLTLSDTGDRGISGSASGAQAHSSGDTFEVWVHPSYYFRDAMLVEHGTDGKHSADIELTTPKITTSINDSNGNEVVKTPATSSAVNEITVTNAATGNAPAIEASGDDTNIDLDLKAKGSGVTTLDTRWKDSATSSNKDTVFLQSGWGFVTGDGSTNPINTSIIYPTAFSKVLSVVAFYIGYKDGSDPTSIGAGGRWSDALIHGSSIGNTSFQLDIYTKSGTPVPNGRRVLFSWIALGQR